jgi:hypothetical protein
MRSALLLCVLALTLASCTATPRDSAKDFKGDEQAVAQAVEDLETAADKNDSDAACTKLFAPQLLASLKQNDKTCKTAVKDAFDDADSTDLSVEDVTITGTKATAKVTSGTGNKKRTDTLELEKSGAAWRISSLQA